MTRAGRAPRASALLALLGVAPAGAGTAAMPQLAFGAGDTHCAPDCPRAVADALRLGFRHVDTAYEYGTQTAVRRGLEASGLPRSEVFVTTKIPGPVGAARAREMLAQDLEELGTGYVDLLLMHYPCPEGWPDPRDACGADEGSAERLATWRAMEEFMQEGKVHRIGVSNFHMRHLRQLLASGNVSVPFSNQIEWHLGWHDEQLLKYCKSLGIQLQAYSPLGGGGTTTGHSGGVPLDDPKVAEVARRHNASGAQVALRWSLDKGVAVVTSTTNPKHMRSDLAVLGFSLAPEEIKVLDTLRPAVPSVQIKDGWPDVTMPVVAMGTWRDGTGSATVEDAVVSWTKRGGWHIDVANATQGEVGAAVKMVLSQGVAARDELFITARVPGALGHGPTRSFVLERLLPALGVGSVDLLLLEVCSPVSGPGECGGGDQAEGLVASWRAMEELRDEGWARSLGAASLTRPQLEQLLSDAHPLPGLRSAVAVLQADWRLGRHDEGLLAFCGRQNITLQARWPLGPEGPLAAPAVQAAAQAHGVRAAEVAVRWSLQRGVPVAAGARGVQEAAPDLGGLFGFALSAAEMSALDALTAGAAGEAAVWL
mmetsp:Transcript_103075/g.291439  ORF Transcript_103075/g.291439 Transcript_103075/m.291439 type:complete len:596 (-) Transcript_103075:11-1798(-)